MPEWLQVMRAWRPIPRTCMIIDFETSGGACGSAQSDATDVILQSNVRTVVDRKIVHSETVLLNWVGAGLLEGPWLQNRINEIGATMLFRDAIYKIKYYDLLERGVDPLSYLTSLYHRVSQHVAAGGWVVGHNFMDFDHRFFVEHLANFCRIYDFNWVERIFDTGAFEIARQLGILPEPGDIITRWLWRARCVRSRVKWSLPNHCADLFNLWLRSGLSPTDAHDAEADNLLVYHLLEGFWELLDG